MGTLISVSAKKRYLLFLNISFLIVASALLIVYLTSSEIVVLSSFKSFNRSNIQHSCEGLKKADDYKDKCFYLKSHDPCFSEGYIDYLQLFYCNLGRFPLLGHCLLFLWLLVLFYLLGNTASEYFCSSLENLSRLLKLSPTIAGVTLLSLGNGAPDVFSSLASFMGSGTDDVGFNTVVGGASFVTCVVVGIISICVGKKHVRVNKSAFIRDVCFLILVLASLIAILVFGEINLWGAIGFSSMYVVYVIVVIYHNNVGEEHERDEIDLSVPILIGVEIGESNCLEEGQEINKCCHCIRSPCCVVFMYILQIPLYIPRRLTIPVVCEKRWSKPMAVISVTLAPLFLSALWNPQEGSLSTTLLVYGIALAFGITFGVLAYATTESSSPPKGKGCLLIWLVGGFIMSVIWTFITAQELVALLVSLGYIFGISPSILGLTVLAWGNSLGDLITNLTMALNGGAEGAQVAITGCYAGPIFNILFGLGLSLVGACWRGYQASVTIANDPYLLETLGFLVGGLLWAVVVLPKRGMRLDGVLGGGLLVIYLISTSLRLIQTLGSFQFLIKM
ncbi:hypothetical protein LWI29_018460 [Acer saccharum]|uniref:Sodium/calcium exchanger membrane region domain-containing protein n=1 Tax=Acer saccharum TaxID=4024 RepID=A0AA39T4R9_ACESA|nr:hypothetical protein LWI29_018460 [Acer saccharum]